MRSASTRSSRATPTRTTRASTAGCSSTTSGCSASRFAVDASGDIYLDGRLPLHAVTADELDRLLGAVLTYSDESFNTILELGFATSIRREWAVAGVARRAHAQPRGVQAPQAVKAHRLRRRHRPVGVCRRHAVRAGRGHVHHHHRRAGRHRPAGRAAGRDVAPRTPSPERTVDGGGAKSTGIDLNFDEARPGRVPFDAWRLLTWAAESGPACSATWRTSCGGRTSWRAPTSPTRSRCRPARRSSAWTSRRPRRCWPATSTPTPCARQDGRDARSASRSCRTSSSRRTWTLAGIHTQNDYVQALHVSIHGRVERRYGSVRRP